MILLNNNPVIFQCYNHYYTCILENLDSSWVFTQGVGYTEATATSIEQQTAVERWLCIWDILEAFWTLSLVKMLGNPSFSLETRVHTVLALGKQTFLDRTYV